MGKRSSRPPVPSQAGAPGPQPQKQPQKLHEPIDPADRTDPHRLKSRAPIQSETRLSDASSASLPSPTSLSPGTRRPQRPGSRADLQSCRVALFLRDESDYQELLREDCTNATRRYGFPLQISAADNDASRQLDAIQLCLSQSAAQRPNVILVSPVREASLLSAAYAAARLGIGWVLLGRWSPYITSLRAEFSHLPIFTVLADQREIGRIQGRQAKALLPQGGELVYIRGPLATFSATQRFEGVQESLQASRIKLLALTSDWTIDGGTRAMNEWLQVAQRREFPKLVVSAQNDAMAMGARAALEEASRARLDQSLQRVPVTGCDGSPDYGRRLVAQGRLKATVIMPPSAGKAVREIAAMPTDGHTRPAAEVILTPTSFPELETLGRGR